MSPTGRNNKPKLNAFFLLFSLTCSGNIICTKRENDIFTATIHIFMVIEAKHSSITIPFYQINLGFMSFVVSITLSSHIDGKVPLVREIQIWFNETVSSGLSRVDNMRYLIRISQGMFESESEFFGVETVSVGLWGDSVDLAFVWRNVVGGFTYNWAKK